MTSNSYEVFVQGLYAAALDDAAEFYPDHQMGFERDIKRLNSLLNNHGLHFLMVTLVEYRKHFDRCLDTGRLTPSNLLGLRGYRKGSPVPHLFKGLTMRVFEDNGRLRIDCDVLAVRLIRQLTSLVSKMRIGCSDLSLRRSVHEFISIDGEVQRPTLEWGSLDFSASSSRLLSFADRPDSAGDEPELPFGLPPLRQLTRREAGALDWVFDSISSELGGFDPAEWRPRHGPGVVADQRRGSYKYDFPTWPARLSTVFSFEETGVSSYADPRLIEPISSDFLNEVPARLAAVPKTLKGPRLIAAEPISYQWCQQIIRDYLMTRVQHSALSRSIHFRDQTVNGLLAQQASHTRSHATIDLSSASDRLSCWLGERAFRSLPCLLAALNATRSTAITQTIDKKSPKLIMLRKLSTMGNATTFPVQSIIFLGIAVAAELLSSPVPHLWKKADFLRSMSKVRVFGDDIIVPLYALDRTREILETLGLKVNVDKTFGGFSFRESCGVDAFKGVNVTPVRILDLPCKSKPGSVMSSVDVHNNLISKGMVHTARFIYQRVTKDRSLRAIRPVSPGSGSFGWFDYGLGYILPTKRRWNASLSRQETRTLVPFAQSVRALPKSSAGMLQFFTEQERVTKSAFSTIGYNAGDLRLGLRLRWDGLAC